MPTIAKIDKIKLDQMLRDGKSQAACARHFGVTDAAITQARRVLNAAIVKNVTLESGHKVLEKSLNAVAQLQKINTDANEILDLLMRWNRGDDEALRILEGQVRKVKIRGSEEEITEYKFKDPRELALKAMAEIRGQLGLQLEILKTLHDVQAVADFQKEVLTAIGEESIETRDRIIRRLKEGRALRASISIN